MNENVALLMKKKKDSRWKNAFLFYRGLYKPWSGMEAWTGKQATAHMGAHERREAGVWEVRVQ